MSELQLVDIALDAVGTGELDRGDIFELFDELSIDSAVQRRIRYSVAAASELVRQAHGITNLTNSDETPTEGGANG